MRVPPPTLDPDAPSGSVLRAAQRGDRKAVSVIARALLPRVRNLVRYLIPGDQDVDDVAQTALVAVLRGLSGFRGDGAFHAWADRVVARSTFGWLRQRKTEQGRLDAAGDPSLVEDPGGMPDEYLERRRVVRALDSLPFEQRHVLVLHYVLGMSVPEIAEDVRAPQETVRSRLRIGRFRLRNACSPGAQQEAV